VTGVDDAESVGVGVGAGAGVGAGVGVAVGAATRAEGGAGGSGAMLGGSGFAQLRAAPETTTAWNNLRGANCTDRESTSSPSAQKNPSLQLPPPPKSMAP
jgi:hypothetical protein